jgi:hypothetical protein
MPDRFRKVTSLGHRVMVQLTPESADSLGLAVTKKTNSRIEVGELYNGADTYDFDYMVKGIRRGYEDYQPVIANKGYVPLPGNLSGMEESKTTTQDYYDHLQPGLKGIFEQNGTLDKGGKVNEALFRKRGWKDVRPGKTR